MRIALLSLLVAVVLPACVVDSGKKPSTSQPPTTEPTTTTPTTPTTTAPVEPSCPNKSNASATYMELSAEECTRALVRCPQGQKGFTDPCGCGCIAPKTPTTTAPTPASNCPSEATAGVSYKSKDAAKCAAMRFACAAGEKPFSSSECGCGCEPKAAAASCPEAAVAGVDYKSKDVDFCSRARIGCTTGFKPFSSTCGCGCVPLAK